jgi:hypothetical protein
MLFLNFSLRKRREILLRWKNPPKLFAGEKIRQIPPLLPAPSIFEVLAACRQPRATPPPHVSESSASVWRPPPLEQSTTQPTRGQHEGLIEGPCRPSQAHERPPVSVSILSSVCLLVNQLIWPATIFIASSPILKTLNVLLINCVKDFNMYKRQLSKYRPNRKLFVFFVWVKKITKNLRIFNPRHCYQALGLRSGIRKKRIQDPGSKKHCIPDPQHRLLVSVRCGSDCSHKSLVCTVKCKLFISVMV